jgi:hypothetical protein
MDVLSASYYSPKDAGSYGGVNRLHQSVNRNNSLSKGDVKRFLKSQDTYTRHKQRYGKFPRRKVTAPFRNYLWQADLLFMKKYKRYNRGYSYLLTVIDVFSRFAFAIPIKNKSSGEIIRGFKEIFNKYDGKPKQLQTDQGTEFFNKDFKDFLKKFNILLFHNFSDFKACVVERFNRTLMTRLSKYFTYTKGYEYLDVLPDILESYNSSVHRGIGLKPKDVCIDNEMEVWMNSNKDLYTKKYKKPKLKLYDNVRLCKKIGIFEKGFAPTHTSEIFQIAEVLQTVPVTFRVKDINNEVISGIFYEQELVSVLD